MPSRAWVVTLVVSLFAMSYAVYRLVGPVTGPPAGYPFDAPVTGRPAVNRDCGSVLGYRTGDYRRTHPTDEDVEIFVSECGESLHWAQRGAALGATVAVTALGALWASAGRQHVERR